MQYRGLILKYKKEILIWFILTLFVLPLKSIGFSTHSANVLIYVKEGLNEEKTRKLLFSMGMIVFIWFITHLFSMIKYRLVIHNDLNFQSDIKRGLYRDYLNKYTDNYEVSKTGEIITSLDTMPSLFGNVLRKLAIYVLPYAIAVFVLALYFFWVDWKIGTLCFVFLTCMTFTVFFFYPRLQKLRISEYKARESLNDSVYDRMGTLLKTIASNKQSKEELHFKEQELVHRKTEEEARVISWTYYVILDGVVFLFIVSILACYFHLFTRNSVNSQNSSKLIASFLVFFSFVSYVTSLKFNFIELMNDYSILNEHNKHLNHQGDKKRLRSKKDFIRDGVIELRDVTFKRGDKYIHKNISIKFLPGKINGVFGPSGSGKTTLLHLISNVYKVYSGEILIDGVCIDDSTKEYLASQISVVHQDVTLNNESFYGDYMKEDIDNAIRDLGVTNVFRGVNREDKIGIGGSKLSRGQRQVLSIIREYVMNKKIYLFDEPTASLDDDSARDVIRMLNEVSRMKKTIIVVSHDIRVSRHVDFFIKMK